MSRGFIPLAEFKEKAAMGRDDREKALHADNQAMAWWLCLAQRWLDLDDLVRAEKLSIEEYEGRFTAAQNGKEIFRQALLNGTPPPAPEEARVADLALRLAADPEKHMRFRHAAAKLGVHEGKGEAVELTLSAARESADQAVKGKLQ